MGGWGCGRSCPHPLALGPGAWGCVGKGPGIIGPCMAQGTGTYFQAFTFVHVLTGSGNHNSELLARNIGSGFALRPSHEAYASTTPIIATW
jgi:hypothetical protein